jgi:KDO2-lipid IV(A) lauroyltransferase
MQSKLARPSRLASAFHRWAMRRGYPLLLWLAPRVSWPVLRRGARIVISLVFAVYRAPLREVERNLSRVLGQPPASPAVRRARREMVFNLAYYWADMFRFSQLSSAEVQAVLRRGDGVETVRRAVARGRGAILLTAHLGNWELGGLFLREQALRVAVVYVPDVFVDAERFRSRLRRMVGVEEIALRPGQPLASLPALRALRDGRLIAMQGDRDFNDTGVRIDFFGEPAPFPRGPFLLARLTGAPLLPSFVVYAADRRFEIEVGEPIEVAVSGDRDADVEAAMRRWVEVLEAAVRRWPTQWYTFYDFWHPRSPVVAPAAPAAPGAVP